MKILYIYSRCEAYNEMNATYVPEFNLHFGFYKSHIRLKIVLMIPKRVLFTLNDISQSRNHNPLHKKPCRRLGYGPDNL